MTRLLSCIQKDIRLLIGSGMRLVATLLLPLLLILVMFFGLSDIANQRTHLPTFSIAVRDLDRTPMSSMLIAQITNIELFESVYSIDEEEDDTVFHEYNVAAILTIPGDFFFSLYDMRNFTVEIALNGNMPLESSIFQSLTTSIMDIISENQQTTWAVHHLQHGELDATAQAELFRQASLNIVEDTLGRGGVFAPEQNLIDDAGSAALFLYGSVMILFLLYIPLSILKTLPEELALGILPRYIAKGGSTSSFILSKGLAAFFICFGVWLLLTLAIFPLATSKAFLLFLVCFLGCFSMFLFLSTIIKDSSHSQIVGNIILLLFMILGGGLYPIQMLPEALHIFSRFTISYYFMMGLTGIGFGFSHAGIFLMVLPVFLMAIIFHLISFWLLRNRGRNPIGNLKLIKL